MVVAGPGDRRDEDIRAIAQKVAGRFDHYICRRDDSLRGRGEDEVPDDDCAGAARARRAAPSAIEIIPDEQAAIDAALRMGRPGDLLLVFADALTRSWKQIIKFKAEYRSRRLRRRAARAPFARPMRRRRFSPQATTAAAAAVPDDAALEAQGFVREERGLRFVGEAAD